MFPPLFCQDMSVVPISPLSVHCKESNVVFYSLSCQELSVNSLLFNTDLEPLDDEKEKGGKDGIGCRRDEWGQYNHRVAYMMSELQGNAPECQILAASTKELTAQESAPPTLLRALVILAQCRW